MNIRARCAAARSYTLIELLIVIGVLGLAGALLIPQLVGRDAMTVQAAVRMLIADVSFAQADALANQEYRQVYFYPDGSGYCLIRAADTDFPVTYPLPVDADLLVDPLKGTPYVVNFPSMSRFEVVHFDTSASTIDGVSAEPSGVYLSFDPLGGTILPTDANAPGTGGQVVIEYDDERYAIIFSAFTGKMTVNRL